MNDPFLYFVVSLRALHLCEEKQCVVEAEVFPRARTNAFVVTAILVMDDINPGNTLK